MKWEETDLEHKLWKIPAQKSKNAEALSVPLVSEVVAILEKRKKNQIVILFSQELEEQVTW